MKKYITIIICLFSVLSTYSAVIVDENRSRVFINTSGVTNDYKQCIYIKAESIHNIKFKLYDNSNKEIAPSSNKTASSVDGKYGSKTNFFYVLEEGKYNYKYGELSGSFIVDNKEVRELSLIEKILDFFSLL